MPKKGMKLKNQGLPAAQPIFCEVCSIELNCEIQAQAHFNGKNHAKKLRLRQRGGTAMLPPSINKNNIHGPDFQALDEAGDPNMVLRPPGMAPPATPEQDFTSDLPPQFDPVSEAVFANMQGILPRKRKIVEIPCAVCAMMFNAPDLAKQHFDSDKHKQKSELVGGIVETGNQTISTKEIPAPSPMADSSPFDVSPQDVKPMLTEQPPSKKGKSQVFYCETCDVSCNSESTMESHKAGAKHRKNVKKGDPAITGVFNKPLLSTWSQFKTELNLGQTVGQETNQTVGPGVRQFKQANSFQCRACKIFFSGPSELHRHLGSIEHSAKLKDQMMDTNVLDSTGDSSTVVPVSLQ